MKPQVRRSLEFVAVGCAAAAVHFAVVVLLVEGLQWRPLVANVAGWLVAFCASFGGHRALTFADRRAPLGRAAARFFLISAGGFAVNESAYALLLNHGAIDYRWALGVVLLAVAMLTYLLSLHWAFLSNPEP